MSGRLIFPAEVGPVSDDNGMLLAKTAANFQNVFGFFSGNERIAGIAARRDFRLNIDYHIIPANPDDIKRYLHILHPERIYILYLENKEHSLIIRQRLPEHQSLFPFLNSIGDLRLDAGIFDADPGLGAAGRSKPGKNKQKRKKQYFAHSTVSLKD
jgi:hypothetical protein